MKTKPPDKDFGVLTGGFSSMRGGGRETEGDGVAAHDREIRRGFESRPPLLIQVYKKIRYCVTKEGPWLALHSVVPPPGAD